MATMQLTASDGKLECCLEYIPTRGSRGRGGDDGLKLQFDMDSFGLLRTNPIRKFKITSPIEMGTLTHLVVAGILDGLLCLKLRYEAINGEALVLWNPATGEAKQIPPLTNYIDFVGFGRDPRTGQYKILAISIDMTTIGPVEKISDLTSIKVAVYSMGAGSSTWRVLDVSYFFDGSRWIDSAYLDDNMCIQGVDCPITPFMAVSADGRMLSMLGRYRVLENDGSASATTIFSSVISFDSSEEVYIQTPLPPDYYTNGKCLLRHCPDNEATCQFFVLWPEKVNIWVLIGCGASGSWTKNISVDTRRDAYRSDIFEFTNFHYWYRQSLVSIRRILGNEGDYNESDPYLSVDEVDRRGETRTLFTIKLPHTKPWRYGS
ncbi:hypothetical protein Dimus_032556 [Dionaea muscipula]